MTEDAKTRGRIPGLRMMAVVRWLILASLVATAAATWWQARPKPGVNAAAQDRYYCPMHPQVRSPEHGTCPICFMNLEPIPAGMKGEVHVETAPPNPPTDPGVGDMPHGHTEVWLTLERRQAIGVATVAVTKRTVARQLRLSAVVEPREASVAEVRVRAPGFVEQVAPVETGATVKAGDPLAWLFVPEISVAAEELLAARKLSQSMNGIQHDDERMIAAARTRLELLGLSKWSIDKVLTDGKAQRGVSATAPISGVVTARNVVLGGYATPDTALFQITDLSKVWVSATVDSESLELAQQASQATFARTGQDRKWTLKPVLIEPTVSVATRTARARFLAENTDGSLLPGQIGEVSISGPDAALLVVPRDAVIDLGTEKYVFVERNAGVFSPRLVRIGIATGGDKVVLDGLKEGEIVVSRGAFLLDSESRLGAAVAPATGGSP
ncbi:MAG: efflux RND transporter periplasmic adaptor subunit [Polyangiaceae bacterium]